MIFTFYVTVAKYTMQGCAKVTPKCFKVQSPAKMWLGKSENLNIELQKVDVLADLELQGMDYLIWEVCSEWGAEFSGEVAMGGSEQMVHH